MSTYGRRGGDGPNTGKRKVTYAAVAPDGTRLRKGTFHNNEPTAFMYIYRHKGTWHASAVRNKEAWKPVEDGLWVTATRVSS